ncbi:CaiB/BaiF CoA transferase family protein [Sphingomonas sp.]|uniref:CaiB/BaiF CoA transferase family protein n=1 Tax=Sphingomonas sp. TaxID=28214 RepID=UPI003B00C3EC
MTGVLSGLEVLDLTRGIAGPMTTMLLADHGARVTRILPPDGDPLAGQNGYRVWQRGKAALTLDLKQERDHQRFLELADAADVVIESFTPGVTERLGIDYATLSARNPGLVYTSITGYGRDRPDSLRPAYDALVAARTGLQWEQRGWPEGTEYHMSRQEGFAPDLEVPQDWLQGPDREGPIFSASSWPSLGAFFAATLGTNAALRARGLSGRGQHVETSLLQGAIAAGWGVWQRFEDPDAPGLASWVFSQRGPKGHFRCADGRWIHHWVPNPRFVIGASEAAEGAERLTVHEDPDRFGMGVEELLVMMHYQEDMAQRFARFSSDYWLETSAAAKVSLQRPRPVEEALTDPLLLKDGCVIELEDPELGPIRQVGTVYTLSACPAPITGKVPEPAETPFFAAPSTSVQRHGGGTGPLAGVRVLDFGVAVAGPYGTALLSDLGADVIKVSAPYDGYWHSCNISFSANRGKRSIALDLKNPASRDIIRRLVESCDIVQHNIRREAAARLGIDYESLKAFNPQLIYCHTRGFEKGERDPLPGNDQNGACLGGIEYEDGAMHSGGKPIWALTSFGDTGNGFLSAIAMVQALIHRDRTGEGQELDTSIIYAALLNTSANFAFPNGDSSPERPRLDREQLGFSALYRLYETQDGWLCLAVPSEKEWRALAEVMGLDDTGGGSRFATREQRLENDSELIALLTERFRERDAKAWFAALDAAGVPCEISDPEYPLVMHDDPDMQRRGWVARTQHRFVGWIDQPGVCVNFSDTPGAVQGPPLIAGDDSREVLTELGYAPAEVERLLGERVAFEPGETSQAA